MRIKLETRRFCALIMLCALVAGAAGNATGAPQRADRINPTPPEHHYYVFDTPVELVLNPRQIAVRRSAAATRSSISDRLSTVAGVSPDAIERSPVNGWSIAHLDSTARSSTDMRASVEALSEDDAIEFASPVFVGLHGGPVVITQQILVQFAGDVDPDSAETILAETGAGLAEEAGFGDLPNAYRVRSLSRSGFDVLDAANRLALRDDVIFAEPDVIFTGRSADTPNDALFSSLWGLENTGQFGGAPGIDMQALDAWDLEEGSSDVLVMVIDNGVDQSHPDINQIPGMDFTTDNGDGGPGNACDRHGTVVAGCVSAIKDNAIGVVGVAPGCRVVSARCMISDMDCSGNWTSQSSWTVSALNWASALGVRVTNNSNGYGFVSSAIQSKYLSTRGEGMVHFASSMNDGADEIGYPASISAVNAVGSIDPNGQRSSFSNYGTGLQFVAPGRNVQTTDVAGGAGYNTTDYHLISGTSFASPYAAGVAALAISMTPELTALEVENILKQTAMDLGTAGYDTSFGHGLVRARDAVEAAFDMTPPGPCMADITGDGVVNTADLGALIGSFGSGGPYADINGDGSVNTADLGILINEFGRDCP